MFRYFSHLYRSVYSIASWLFRGCCNSSPAERKLRKFPRWPTRRWHGILLMFSGEFRARWIMHRKARQTVSSSDRRARDARFTARISAATEISAGIGRSSDTPWRLTACHQGKKWVRRVHRGGMSKISIRNSSATVTPLRFIRLRASSRVGCRFATLAFSTLRVENWSNRLEFLSSSAICPF